MGMRGWVCCAVVCGAGCVSQPLSVHAPRLPFDPVGAERRFLGPVGFHNVTVSVEVGHEEADQEINIYPPGIVMVGERVVVSKDPDRHFMFTIDDREQFLRKGSDVYVFNPAPDGVVEVKFHELAVTLIEKPERRVVLVMRREGLNEELRHGNNVLKYDGRRLLTGGGADIPASWRARGVRMPRDGEVTPQ
jgi:hypothetical protein